MLKAYGKTKPKKDKVFPTDLQTQQQAQNALTLTCLSDAKMIFFSYALMVEDLVMPSNDSTGS